MDSVDKTAKFIKKKFLSEHTGHDWWHMERVWKLSKQISKSEKNVNTEVVELAALLHDIADHKFHGGDTEVGAFEAGKWMKSISVQASVIIQVQDIVRHISFKSIKHKPLLNTIEGKVVHDADKLDAMGAIGIARVMVFGGTHDRLIYSPDIPVMEDYTFEKTNPSNTTAINHFYEKLLHLKDRMLTETGKKMAEHRHKYMEEYLKEFYAEWDGKQ